MIWFEGIPIDLVLIVVNIQRNNQSINQSINLFHTMQYIVLVYTENNNILRIIHSIHDIYIYTHINAWCG